MEQMCKQQETSYFSPSLEPGQGDFGTFYRGTLDDGTLVAMKVPTSKRIGRIIIDFQNISILKEIAV